MDATITDEAELSNTCETVAVLRLRRAHATLTGSDEGPLQSTPTTYSLAQAFCNAEVTPLRLYQAASHMRESQLREVVQFLIFSGPRAALVLLRILSIMQGLPGNWELTMEFLEQQTAESFKSFPTRVFSLIAMLGGRKAYNLCDWSPAIERAFRHGENEARWALSTLSEYLWKGPTESVLRVFEWDTELPYESDPSIWREIQWTVYARTLCINSNDREVYASRSGCDSPKQEESTFGYLSAHFGTAAPHYVRISGTLMRKRLPGKISAISDESHPETTNHNDKISPDDPVVLTSTTRETVNEMAAYLAYGVPFILEGPTGCGKTALISLLARKTAYESERTVRDCEAPGVTFIQMDSAMLLADGEAFSSLIGCVVPIPEGGGFRWRPGPLGAAAERGDWIVFENIGRSTGRMSSAAAIIRKLATAKPGDKLEAPGRGEPIIIGRGFRCMATRTVSQEGAVDTWEPPGGWDTWCRITMNELSFDEKVRILSERYVRIGDCIPRVVTVVEQVANYTGNLRGPLFRTPTLREAVRICQRLDSEKRKSGSLGPENAFLETMDVLAAWCSTVEHFDELSNIASLCWSLSPQVGAEMYSKHRPDMSRTGRSVRIGRASAAKSAMTPATEFSRLSLTGHTRRLLERTLRCLELGENVLLSGETGSGKTALIQELASLMGKKLVVVNLSRQSELDDLVGGFRPVDRSAAVPLLAKRFESAFCQCMSKEKNADFLDALQRASRSLGHHHRALRLMEGAFKAIPNLSKQRSPSVRQEWDDIAAGLEKLTISHSLENDSYRPLLPTAYSRKGDASQEPLRKRPRVSPPRARSTESALFEDKKVCSTPRKRSRRIDFEFSDGVLVQAMRDGDWILLDELNLAPPELLERLVSVLEVGKITLGDEQGDVVTKRDGFVLFGAMNPPTDTGKRPLPSVLRARFTEFHVGDMVKREDLFDLIVHKFLTDSSLKEEKSRISRSDTDVASDTVDFYLNSYEMAKQGRLEDSTGKPVRFSLRSLSRMLDFASGLKGFLRSGSEVKRRALFEGALAALGTQLPKKSQAQLSDMAERYLLQRVRQHSFRSASLVELMSVPQNSGIFLRMLHGFPVEVRCSRSIDTTEEKPRFIVTPAVEKTLIDVCRALVVGAPKLPILLQGPTAAGKTSLIGYLAERTGNTLIRINNHEHTEISEYIGGYVATQDGSLVFTEGPLVRAARNGDWVMLDELNLAPPDVLESLNRLLDDNREVFLPETAEVVKAARGFRLFATQNPPGLYGGRKELSRAFRSRFIEVQVDALPDQDLETILEKRADIPVSFARKMVAILRDLQMQRRSSDLFSGREGYITARDLFRWASRGPRSKEELAIHGFLLLAERARSMKERELVRDVICKQAGVTLEVLSDDNLYAFDLAGEGNDASKQCLDFSLQKLSLDRVSISRALFERNIVLTPSMKRMLTLLIHCTANGEPTLLVGATGGGKTTSCAAIAAALFRQLLTINCHRHTEASDILGGFRPARQQALTSALFEWVDGPLIQAMKTGAWLLVDEINMADDAVIERLNSVLEFGRTLLLSEKGTDKSSASPEVVVAEQSFRILATMNPGGDFGKKELSPALRNRFTELWIPPPLCNDDYLPIIYQRLGCPPYPSEEWKMASFLVQDTVKASLNDSKDKPEIMGTDHHSLQISVRDLTAWCDFIVSAPQMSEINPLLAAVHGSRLVFLDGLSVGLTSSHYMKLEVKIWHRILGLVPTKARKDAEQARYAEGIDMTFQIRDGRLKVDRFCVPCNSRGEKDRSQDKSLSAFSFDAPSTVRNSARIARAMCVGTRPILLEGPPGSGKSSLIAALASISGYKFSRVNLSEGTEMSDLVGCDAPGQDQGSFIFRRGPLLEALNDGSWILLDELNLASQSVLEGLNSVLDHRKTLFVPELNKEFTAHKSFRIFGAQNSAADGGGRRGLPRSFLNRFMRVHIEAPGREDIKSIINSLHPQLSSKLTWKVIECLHNLCAMKDSSRSSERFGLRDAIRWCDLLSGIGSRRKSWASKPLSRAQLYMCFDIAILRSLRACERVAAEDCFESAFGYACDSLRTSPALRPRGRDFGIGLGTIENSDIGLSYRDPGSALTLLVPSRSWELQAISFAINACWPVTLFSPYSPRAGFGVERVVHQIATLFGKRVSVFEGASLTDAEDFVGGYVQQDVIASMRLILTRFEELLRMAINMKASEDNGRGEDWGALFPDTHIMLTELRNILEAASKNQQSTVRSLPAFLRSSNRLMDQIGNMAVLRSHLESSLNVIKEHHAGLKQLHQSLLTGHFAPFKWRKSDLMNAIEAGEWILMRDADACPPALLDRLNPIFERAAVSSSEENCAEHTMTLAPMILAEAPSNEDGSPVLLHPHPHFRMFFCISKPVQDLGRCGLSRALLDRSLKLCVEKDVSDHDKAAFVRLAGLSSDQWPQCFAKNDDIPDFDVSSYRGVLDCQTRAERVRFMMREEAKVAPMETKCQENTGPPCNLQCTGILAHSLDDLPFTSVGEYVDNPVLSSTVRDIYSLRLLETVPDETVLRLVDRVRQRLELGSTEKDTSFYESSIRQSFSLEAVRQMLLASGANAFLFGSISPEDLAERAIILRKRATFRESCPPYTVYFNRSDAAYHFLSSLKCPEGNHLAGFRWRPCTFPLDPVFGLDRSSLHLASLESENELKILKHHAKRLRVELLALYRLRETWSRAKDNVADETFLNRAKLTYELHDKKLDAEDVGLRFFEDLAFDAVSSAGAGAEAYCRLIQIADKWEIENEEEWMTFFASATSLCELMTLSTEPSLSSLAAMLYNIALALEDIEDRANPCFDDVLEGLYRRLKPFRTHISNLLGASKLGAMPSSRLGQDTESGFMEVVNSRRGELTVTQMDAVGNGLATLTMQNFDSDKVVLAKLRKVVEFIKEESSLDGTRTFALDHWSRVARQVCIRAAQEIICVTTTQELLQSPINSAQSQVLQLVGHCVNYMKCLPHTNMSSVACMQKLRWIVESAAKLKSSLTCVESSHDHLHSLISLSVLDEINSLLAVQHKPQDDGTCKHDRWISSLSSTLFLAQGSYALPFWTLSQAYGEAVCTTALISRGKHKINHTGDFSKVLLQHCIKSISDQGGTINDSSLDSTVEEYNVPQPFVSKAIEASLPEDIHRKSKLQEDLAGMIQRAVSDVNGTSELDKTVLFGKAWVSLGLAHLNSHYEFIKQTNGIDPAQFSISVASLSLREVLSASASSLAYEIFANHRLAGTSFSESVPAKRFSRTQKVGADIIVKASIGHVFRSPEKASFDSYQAFVAKVHASVTRRVIDTGLLGKVCAKHSPAEQEQFISEAIHLVRTCTALASELKSQGSFGHFRDISTNLALGLQEVQYGLYLFRQASEKCSVYCSPKLEKRMSFVTDVMLFPRAVHKQSTRALDSLKACLKLDVDANCIMALANYLVSVQLHTNDYRIEDTSLILSELVAEWKKRTLADEREVERKESLHVLREAGRKELIPGGDIVERLVIDEDTDFVKTFNPITQGEEEELFGLSSSQDSEPATTTPGNQEEMEKDYGHRISPESFWNLHKRVYPALEKTHRTSQSLSIRIQQVSSLSSHLFLLTSGILPAIDDISSVWETFASHAISLRHTICTKNISDKNVFNSPSAAPYNFYTDANIEELAKASRALQSLNSAICRVQRSAFKETGNHPVLDEVEIAIQRVAKLCKTSTPLSRVVLGIENVLRKADEWQRLFATSSTRLDSHVLEVAKVVAHWRRLEAQSWPLLLQSRVTACEQQGCRWIFLLYDAILHEGIQSVAVDADRIKDVIASVDQFLRSSTRGEFGTRLEMILSLSRHVLARGSKNEENVEILGRCLSGLGEYYGLFLSDVQREITHAKRAVDKELSEFTQLTSWNAAHDLGSSCKMSKEKDKYLQYYRLKAAAEKTRRKLHKLCLKVDTIVRAPVHESLSLQLSKVSFFCSLGEECSSETKDAAEMSFSDRIRVASQVLTEDLVSGKGQGGCTGTFIILGKKGSLLSQVRIFEEKINSIGTQLPNLGNMKCELATIYCVQIRAAMRNRILQLRNAADIQVKKRALVELFKVLQTAGISPFERSTRTQPHEWLSAPNPSFCAAYNAVANELFWKSASQLQRLQGVSDTRLRNPDLANSDVAKMRAFCQYLFDQACAQRRVLNEVFDDVQTLSKEVSALNRLKVDEEARSLIPGTRSAAHDLSKTFRKLKQVSIDLQASEEIFKQVVKQVQHTGSIFRGSTDQLGLLIEIHSKDSIEDLKALETVLNWTVAAVKEAVTDEKLTSFEEKRGCRFGFFDGAYAKAFLEARDKLSKLAVVLKQQHAKARDISPDSFVSLALTPVLSFVQDALQSKGLSMCAHGQKQECEFDKVWSQINDDANSVIETILISSQKILAWNDLTTTREGLQNTNANATLKEYTLSDLGHSGLMKLASTKLLSLSSIMNTSGLLLIVDRNADSVRRLSESNVDSKGMSKVLQLQQTLARFLERYLNIMIIPCVQKAAQFHAHSLSLLRSLSSVFIGLCLEGFCRPPEHDNDAVESCETDGRQGVGFGEVGDGDMSSAQNVSDQVEDEEQLLGLRDDMQKKNEGSEPRKDEDQDQDGVDMTTDFEGELKDPNDEEGAEGEYDEADKEMAAESGIGDNTIDERIWGNPDEPRTDGPDQGKDTKEADSSSVNKNSELVAKYEETAGKDEGRDDSDRQDERQAPARDEDQGKQEYGTEEENKVDKNESNEEAKPERPRNSQENPFNSKMDVDSDEKDQEDMEENSISSPHPSPKRADDSTLRNYESVGNSVEDDTDADDSDNGPGGFEADDREAESVLSDASDRDKSQEDAMLGVEQSKDANQTDDGAQGGSTELSDVPGELNLDECLDSGTTSGEEEEEHEGMEKSTDNSNDKEMKHKDNLVTDDEDLEKEEAKHSGMENSRNSLDQQQRSLSRQRETITAQPSNGSNAAGDERMQEKDEAPMTGDQGARVDGTDDVLAQDENEKEPAVGGSALRGLQPTANQSVKGDIQQSMDSPPSETGKQNSYKLNPNPLRVSSPQELVTAWERHLKVMENERENGDAEPSPRESDEVDGLWEYQSAREAHENHMHALGAATDDQHRPLNVGEEEDNAPQSPVQEPPTDEAGGNDKDALRPPASVRDGKIERQGDTEEGDADNADAGVNEEDNQTFLRSHPAHNAAQGISDSISSPVNNPLNFTRREEASDRMDVDHDEEPKRKDVPLPQIKDKLTWQMETLDEKTAIELWHQLNLKVSAGASMLCEQLRLVLEPTVVSGLSGGYRTGKRLNMRKVIEYVASDFQRDRIWLRRVKPDKRAYDVLVAIDDSASMAESEAGAMAIESLALVLSALSRLEIGRIGVARFGAEAEMIQDFDEALPLSAECGGKLLRKFSFSQRHTDIVKLLSFIQARMGCNLLGDVEHVSLALVISDGRLSDREEVRRQLRHLKNSNVLIAFVILDQVFGDQASIYEVKRVDYDKDGSLTISPYMEDFPIDFYTTVQDMRSLPAVLGDALRQWVEAASA